MVQLGLWLEAVRDLYLYQGKDAVELRSKGLQLEPYLQLKYPFDWKKLFDLTIN